MPEISTMEEKKTEEKKTTGEKDQPVLSWAMQDILSYIPKKKFVQVRQYEKYKDNRGNVCRVNIEAGTFTLINKEGKEHATGSTGQEFLNAVKTLRTKKKYSLGDEPDQDAPKFIKEGKNQESLWVRFPRDEHDKYAEKLEAIHFHFFNTAVINGKDGKEILVEQWRGSDSSENLQAIVKFGKSNRFVFDGDIAIRGWASTSEGSELEKMSYAKSSSEYEDRIKEIVKKAKAHDKSITFRPFQAAGVAYMLKAKRSFLADEMGLGKTFQGTAAAAIADAWPLLVICPATLKLNWEAEIHKWMPDKKGTTIVPTNKDIDILHKGLKMKVKKTAKNKKGYVRKPYDVVIINYDRLGRWMDHIKKIQWRAIIFDESHYLAHRSGRTKEAIKFVEEQNPEYVWMLTGTPIKSYPRELCTQLRIMGRLQDFGGGANFIRRYCVLKSDGKAVDSTTAKYFDDETRKKMYEKMHENMIQLNKQLRSMCYVRREKSEVLTDLPPKTRSTIAVELTDNHRKEYEKVESDVVAWLMDQCVKDEEFLKSIKKLPKQEREAAISERRASVEYRSARAEALVRIEYCKQIAAIGKLESVKEFVEDYTSHGDKLVVFATHTRVIDELKDKFEDAMTITGGDSITARKEYVDRFQDNSKKKKGEPKDNIILASIKAGGVGLTLTAAHNAAIVELPWTPAALDQAEDRLHRIGQKDAVTIYYLIAKDTIEEKIARLIEKKRMIVNAVADGDPLHNQAQGSILGDLVHELTGKHMMAAEGSGEE